jgi:hypothetical protein
MLKRNLNKGDIVKLPQGVILYRKTIDGNTDEMNLVYAEEAEKPSIAIFIEDFNERVSKLIYQDQIRYVYSEWLFNIEETDAYQINNNPRRDYQF